MDTVVDRYFPVLDKLETDLEKLEVQIFRGAPTRSNIESFYDLKYRLMVLKHAVAPLMEAVGKLFGGRVPPVCLGSQEYFRDVYDHLARINASIESLREMLQTGDLGVANADQPRRQRGDEAARRVRCADHRADADRRHLRHELRAHAGAARGRSAIRWSSARWLRSTSCCSSSSGRRGWL